MLDQKGNQPPPPLMTAKGGLANTRGVVHHSSVCWRVNTTTASTWTPYVLSMEVNYAKKHLDKPELKLKLCLEKK